MQCRTYVAFLFIKIVVLTALLNNQAFCQKTAVSYEEKMLLSGALSLPALKATMVNTGDKVDLKTLQARDLKYSDKPTLMIFWAWKWCPPCIRKIDTLVTNGMDKNFNIIAVNVDDYTVPNETAPSRTIGIDSLRNFMAERKGWNRITQLQVNYYDWSKVFGLESTPFWLMLTTDLKVVRSSVGYGMPLARMNEILIEKTTAKPPVANSTFYLNNLNEGLLVDKEKATIAVSILKKVDKYQVKKLLLPANQLFAEFNYVSKNDDYLYNGLGKTFYTNGKIQQDLQFVNGNLVKGKIWYSNGDMQGDINVPLAGAGFKKTYSENGVLNQYALFADGKLNGLSKVYDEFGRVKEENEYKNDKQEGLSKVLMQGILYKEITFKSGKLLTSITREQNIPLIKEQLIKDMNAVLKKGSAGKFIPEVSSEGFIMPGDVIETDEKGNEFAKTIKVLNWADIDYLYSTFKYVQLTGKVNNYSTSSTDKRKREYQQKSYSLSSAAKDDYVIKVQDEARKQLMAFIETYRSFK